MAKSRASKQTVSQPLDAQALVDAFVVETTPPAGGPVGKFRLSQTASGKRMQGCNAAERGELVAAVFERTLQAERDADAIKALPAYHARPYTHPDWGAAWGVRMALLVALRELLRKNPALAEGTVVRLVEWIAGERHGYPSLSAGKEIAGAAERHAASGTVGEAFRTAVRETSDVLRTSSPLIPGKPERDRLGTRLAAVLGEGD